MRTLKTRSDAADSLQFYHRDVTTKFRARHKRKRIAAKNAGNDKMKGQCAFGKRASTRVKEEMNTSVLLFVWGAIVALSGISGYATKGSIVSLIAGVVVGALIIAGGALLKNGKDFGFWLGVVGTALLLMQFVPAYLRTQHLWPAGIMSVLSVIALVAMFVSRRA